MSKLTVFALCCALLGAAVLSTTDVSAAPASPAGISAPSDMVTDVKMSKKQHMMMMRKKKMMMMKKKGMM